MNLQKYHTANLPELVKIISKNGIGMDDYLDRFFNSYETTTNYPPYNLIHVNNIESVLEIALAGFSKKELKVYTEYGKLIVCLLYTSPSPRDVEESRMPSSA